MLDKNTADFFDSALAGAQSVKPLSYFGGGGFPTVEVCREIESA